MKKTPENTIVKIEHNGVAFGCMGRSGSTNLLRYFKQQRIDCHCLIEEFNDYEGESYLILRNPLDRYKSSINSGMGIDEFHGLPFLDKINWNNLDGIIPFEDLSKYINPKGFGWTVKTESVKHNENPITGLLDMEMVLYNMWRRKMPVLTPEKFKEITQWDT